jgi:hypothetical protein
MLDGVRQPPFTLGFAEGSGGDALLVASTCPPTLLITAIAASSPADAPASFAFQVILDGHLVSVHMVVQSGCGGGSALVCTPT